MGVNPKDKNMAKRAKDGLDNDIGDGKSIKNGYDNERDDKTARKEG